MLSVVATPIGNMDDITLRAIEVLKSCDLVAAEDTRHTGKLLKHHNISVSLTSYHDHNERQKTPYLLDLLKQGKHIAIVTDAGTPGISDPAYLLVREAAKNGIKIQPIPGASAPINALVASGLPMDQFSFVGFLPKQPGKKKKLIQMLGDEQRTFVCFESPHRIMRTLEQIANLLPNREICLARELTKKHEEFLRGTAAEVLELIRTRMALGELTLVISSGRKGQTDTHFTKRE